MLTQIIPDFPSDVLQFSEAFVYLIIGCLDFTFTYSDYTQLFLVKHRSIICTLFFAEHKESIEWIVFDNAFDLYASLFSVSTA